MQCRNRECGAELPKQKHGGRRYCNSDCYQLSRRKRQKVNNNTFEIDYEDKWYFAESKILLGRSWKCEIAN